VKIGTFVVYEVPPQRVLHWVYFRSFDDHKVIKAQVHCLHQAKELNTPRHMRYSISSQPFTFGLSNQSLYNPFP